MTRAMLVLALVACNGTNPDDVWLPNVDEATFVTGVDNPFMPLPAGGRWVYEADTDEGLERDEVWVIDEEKVVQGVTATVVRDTVYLDGEVVEDTWDWFAQDSDGNVWYLGEDTCEFENGECVLHAGAWEWGVDGALPGIIMPGDPTVDGQPFYQEYYPGEAEDVGEVIAVDEAIEVEAGSFTGCVRTHDTSTLERSLDEEKVYCPGIGVVYVDERDFEVGLIEYEGL